MFTIHLVAYTTATETGIARVGTDHNTPTPEELAADIPGLLTAVDLGREPQYTLRYEKNAGPMERTVSAAGVQKVGRVLMSLADRDEVWAIECFDERGYEVTFNFAVFTG
ncbi:hypothetical protein STAN_1890 [Streptomyces sp. CBMAI 2042]|uniref:hypothetical protein n=1 Tax=Streptomyces sp. CBMAI 2042 TaxID=2305222 RepID=UPI000F1E8E3F|nr:hypothetical protein [Streptomyces sp. CBMAI 2042]RLV66369.1 hypothetical protein STAN_1890 [Streptomyces sp. CBMAI 2042]